MAEHFLRDHPGLRPFVLSDVQLTGTEIGSGSYGKVEEVVVPVNAAAKTTYAVLREAKAATEFVRECQLMSTLRHPNIVQFLGVTFIPGSTLPALVMERLLMSLHDLLGPDPSPPSDLVTPLSFFSLALKCSVLHNVASGLAYLHERSPPVIHRDLSARNVLLDWEMVAKIADLGVARMLPRERVAATMTKGPGTLVYMPPEAFAEKSKYDASIDIFSVGVITIFTVGEVFPCDPIEPTYVDENSGLLVARSELQRRSQYMRNVNDKLRACGQLRGDHPLIRLIQGCLHNLPSKRPDIRELLHLLDEARAGVRDEGSERNKRQLVQALQTQPRNQNNLEHLLRDMVTESAKKDKELAGARQQLQYMNAELERSKAALTRAEETIRREQSQEMRRRETGSVQTALLHQQLGPKVLGPGFTSATVNHKASILLEFSQVNVTAQLQPLPNASASRSINTRLPLPPSTYEVPHTPVSRGQHKLHVQVNDREINGSPFTVTVYPDPTKLGHPVRTLTGFNRPRGIAFNSHRQMIVTEWGDNKLSIFDVNGRKFRSFGSVGSGPGQMIYPKTVVTDDADNVYVSSDHKLQKFTSNGDIVRCIGGKRGVVGSQKGEFHFPRGIKLYKKQVYVCDSKNHRIQVFDLDLNFVRCIDTQGFIDTAYDIELDAAGNMYVADKGNKRVIVMNNTGRFVRSFGKGNLVGPYSLHIADKHMYVCDNSNRVVVFETSGQFVTSFGSRGRKDGEFDSPRCITSCSDGFMYVCDFTNNRIQIF